MDTRKTACSLSAYDDRCSLSEDGFGCSNPCRHALTREATPASIAKFSSSSDIKSLFDEEKPSAFSLIGCEVPLRSPTFDHPDTHGAYSALALDEMLKKQTKNRYFNPQPHHVSYRVKVVGWMRNLVVKFGYSQSTFHFAVGYFDAVLSLYTVTVKQIKLISYICLYLAAKMEEKDCKVPSIHDAFKLFDNEFSSTEITNCEKLVFKILDYQLNIKTPFAFAVFFLARGVLLPSEVPPCVRHADQEINFAANLENRVQEYLGRALQNYDFYRFSSIAVAGAAIAFARKSMSVANVWSDHLQNVTLLNWSAIKECYTLFEGEEWA